MVTYKSSAVNSGLMPDLALAGVVLVRTAEVLISTATSEIATSVLTINDVLQMVPVPEGAQIIDIQIKIDSLMAPSGIANIGDGGDPDRYFENMNFPTQVKGFGYLTHANAGFNKVYQTNDTIDITFLSDQNDSGHTLTMNVWYKMQGSIDDES